MILIGSSAMRYWFPDFPREPKDIDYVVQDPSQYEKKEGTEYLVNPVLNDYPHSVLDPYSLLTLKMSHLFWDINWEKHMFDVQFLIGKGYKFNRLLFDELYAYWNVVHEQNKRSDLKMSAEDFFTNALKCEYHHDELHTLLKATPTYQKVLIGEVEVGEELFNSLSFEEKKDLVYEEVMVMAWERYSTLNYRSAYSKMLKKFIISHAPMWEAIFIIENFKSLYLPPYNYFKTIEDGLHKLQKKVVLHA